MSSPLRTKKRDRFDQSTWFRIKPKNTVCPRIYGLPKVHKPGVPLRMIVDFTSSPTFNLARYLSRIISPVMGKTVHRIKNSTHFLQKLRPVQVTSTKMMVRFEISSLFTNVPIAKTMDILINLLINDPSLKNRTALDTTDVTH